MNKYDTLTTMILAASTSMAIGTFLLQTLGAFVLGIAGALAGWFFSAFIKPKLEAWKVKLKSKKIDKEA